MTHAIVTADAILGAFASGGLRSTRQRRLIAERLARLAAASQDFATEDLWRDLLDSDPQIGRATVYRAVDTLAEAGVLDRIEFADATHRYRVCGGAAHHHHLTCVQCRRIVEIDACLPSALLARIETTTDFTLEGHAIELFGRCAACRAMADAVAERV